MSLVQSAETATQKALRIPEIVALIAEELYDGAVARGHVPDVLRSFIHVNHLWYDSAIQLLWRHLSKYGRNLVSIFQKVHPTRHRFYAAFIQDARVQMERPDNEALVNLLREVEFPMLKTLRVDWMIDCSKIQIPVLGKNTIEMVDLALARRSDTIRDSMIPLKNDTFRSSAKMIPLMLAQSLAMFPDLQWLRLRYPSQILHILGDEIAADYDLVLKKLYHAGFEAMIGPKYPRNWTVFNRPLSSNQNN